MEDQILKDIKELRKLLSQIVGTSDLQVKEQFSPRVLSNAAKEFKSLSIKRGEWTPENDLHKVFKGCHWDVGKFIFEKFEFKNYFKHGRTTFYNKKDLLALKNELIKRNIHLGKYIELIKDQEKYDKKLKELATEGKKKKRFHIPSDLSDIEKRSYKPSSDIEIKEHIASLKEEFNKNKLSEYIQIYKDSHALVKYEYYFEKYIDSDIKRQCKRWVDDFNTANRALIEFHKVGEDE